MIRNFIEDLFNEDMLWIFRTLLGVTLLLTILICTYIVIQHLENQKPDIRWICPDGGVIVRLDTEGRRICADGRIYEPTLEKYED